MSYKRLGYIAIAILVALAGSLKILYDKNERSTLANLQPEISPPPPDQMWAHRPTASPAQHRQRGMQMMQRPNPVSSPSPSPTPTGDSRSDSRADGLIRDRDQLQLQINQLAPTELDRRIAVRSQELQRLFSQNQQYQAAEQSMDQQMSNSLQFRSVLQQSMMPEPDNRIRIQDRLIQSSNEQIAAVNLNPGMYDPGFLPGLQAQLNAQQQQLQSLIAQRSTMSADTMNEMDRLNQQSITTRAVLASARAAVESQISFLQQDLERLNQEKNNAEALRTQYQRELDQVNQQLPRKTITFP